MRQKFLKLYADTRLRYLFVGGSTFALDIGILYLLRDQLDYGLALATTVAFWVAMVYNFLATRYWAFKHTRRQGLEKHFGLYLLLVGSNYVVTLLLVGLLSQFIYFLTAKIIVVALQTCWNYLAYKYIIFKH